jgi:hypothetical protein
VSALLGVGLALSAPLAAGAATSSYDLDCASLSAGGHSFPVLPGDTVTLNLTGFDSINEFEGAVEPAPIGGVPAASIVADAGDEFVLYDTTCLNSFFVSVYEASPETIPSGSLLSTQVISISSPAPQISLVENDGGSGEHLLAGNEDCGLSTDAGGAHVYGTLDITVTTAGTYTFKGLFTTPAGSYTGLNPFDPIEDPFLAVYSEFDPSNPDSGVVGCNDDLNDVGPGNHDAEYRADNSIIEGHVPYFSADLEPGQYTLVLLTWEDLSTSDFDAGTAPYSETDFAVGTKSTTFELWGPTGGIILGHVALAATGVGTGYGLVGLAAAGLGTVLLLVAVRRRRNA